MPLSQFGQYEYREAMDSILDLKQHGSVEDYAAQFEELYYQINMHHSGYDPVFFISQFINGLKQDIRLAVLTQVPPTLHRAIMLAKLQERVMEKGKDKFQKSQLSQKAPTTSKQTSQTSPLWKERQKRDYCKANGLCYWCSEKYDPAHAAICPKRLKAQVNALSLSILWMWNCPNIF